MKTEESRYSLSILYIDCSALIYDLVPSGLPSPRSHVTQAG